MNEKGNTYLSDSDLKISPSVLIIGEFVSTNNRYKQDKVEGVVIEGHVRVRGFPFSIIIKSSNNFCLRAGNGALHGDEVAVQLYDSTLWDEAPWLQEAKDIQNDSSFLNDSDIGNEVEGNMLWGLPLERHVAEGIHQPLIDECKKAMKQPVGKVTRVISSSHRSTLVGTISLSLKNSDKYIFQPLDSLYPLCTFDYKPDIYPLPPQNELKHILYVAHIKDWSEYSLHPCCEIDYGNQIYSESLQRYIYCGIGVQGECDVEYSSLKIEHRIQPNYKDFSLIIQNELREILGEDVLQSNGQGWQPQSNTERFDFTKISSSGTREYHICSIDPPSTRDVDDAIHIGEIFKKKQIDDDTLRSSGIFEIGVHIADVSEFVGENSSLDKVALERAKTIYLQNETIPMLPDILSHNLCSLLPGVDRYALSCIFYLDINGSVVEESREDLEYDTDTLCTHFVLGKINSCCKLDYFTAEKMINSDIGTNECENDITSSIAWPCDRRPKKVANGIEEDDQSAMTSILNSVKLLHSIMQRRVERRSSSMVYSLSEAKGKSNQLVEECMLLANYFAARETVKHFGSVALLRSRPPTQAKKVKEILSLINKLCRRHSWNADFADLNELLSSLPAICETCQFDRYKDVEKMAMDLVLYQSAAAEMILGDLPSRHTDLSIPYYTHFTSPIRRYTDIVVHRQLKMILSSKYKEISIDIPTIKKIANQCNIMQANATRVQDKEITMNWCFRLKDKPQNTYYALIQKINAKYFVLKYVDNEDSTLTVTTIIQLESIPNIISHGISSDGNFLVFNSFYEKKNMQLQSKSNCETFSYTSGERVYGQMRLSVWDRVEVSLDIITRDVFDNACPIQIDLKPVLQPDAGPERKEDLDHIMTALSISTPHHVCPYPICPSIAEYGYCELFIQNPDNCIYNHGYACSKNLLCTDKKCPFLHDTRLCSQWNTCHTTGCNCRHQYVAQSNLSEYKLKVFLNSSPYFISSRDLELAFIRLFSSHHNQNISFAYVSEYYFSRGYFSMYFQSKYDYCQAFQILKKPCHVTIRNRSLTQLCACADTSFETIYEVVVASLITSKHHEVYLRTNMTLPNTQIRIPYNLSTLIVEKLIKMSNPGRNYTLKVCITPIESSEAKVLEAFNYFLRITSILNTCILKKKSGYATLSFVDPEGCKLAKVILNQNPLINFGGDNEILISELKKSASNRANLKCMILCTAENLNQNSLSIAIKNKLSSAADSASPVINQKHKSYCFLNFSDPVKYSVAKVLLSVADAFIQIDNATVDIKNVSGDDVEVMETYGLKIYLNDIGTFSLEDLEAFFCSYFISKSLACVIDSCSNLDLLDKSFVMNFSERGSYINAISMLQP